MIKLVNLTKSYPLYRGRHFVFKNFNFDFPENCSIGLMGRNGAGKSTLMKILAGFELPDSGRVITNKKLSWPLGLNGAFQGSLTARDNAKFVARVYGYKGEELLEKVRFVEDFAELGKFFDEPMKTYSSGMSARIAFGLSMAFDFDYYLIDEAGAVGDPSFKEKSVKLYKQRLSQSKVIMVSHDAAMIREWCHKIIYMKDGKATVYDDIEEGLAVYQGRASQLFSKPDNFGSDEEAKLDKLEAEVRAKLAAERAKAAPPAPATPVAPATAPATAATPAPTAATQPAPAQSAAPVRSAALS